MFYRISVASVLLLGMVATSACFGADPAKNTPSASVKETLGSGKIVALRATAKDESRTGGLIKRNQVVFHSQKDGVDTFSDSSGKRLDLRFEYPDGLDRIRFGKFAALTLKRP